LIVVLGAGGPPSACRRSVGERHGKGGNVGRTDGFGFGRNGETDGGRAEVGEALLENLQWRRISERRRA
jgi:hypothetical protein